jgi:ABC-2 type transport system permease protein
VVSALPSSAAARALVRAGFRRYAIYRRATLAGAFTNTVFGVIRVSILFAAADAAGGSVAGYDRAALSTYTWVGQGLIAVVWLFAWTPVTQRVRSGDVAIDLGRPVHPIAAWLAEDIGRAGQACLIRFIGPLLVGGLLYGLQVPTRWTTVPLFVLSAGLAVVVSFGGRILVSLIAFWLVDVRGVLRTELRDLAIAEPDIEDVVARLYRCAAAARSSTVDSKVSPSVRSSPETPRVRTRPGR